MARRAWQAARCGVVAWALFGASVARAQVIQDCQPDQYVDRSAASADRQIDWEFGISSDPERCLQVRVGQTVVWNGDLDNHPLGGSGGDTPNPISLHQNGSVTFTRAGTFGYVCLAHSPMKGAIKVLPALPLTATPAPALTPWLAVALAAALLGMGALVGQARSEDHRRDA